MLFQGQEFAASAPFLYFADHKAELKAPVSSGRREFLAQFPSVTDPEVLAALPSPVDEETFLRCKLDPGERERHPQWYALHRDLIHLRRSDPVILRAADRRPDGAVIGPGAFILRYFGGEDGDRLLVVNLGCDIDLHPVPEPLLAPPFRVPMGRALEQRGAPLRGQWHAAGAAALSTSTSPAPRRSCCARNRATIHETGRGR